MTKTQIKNLIVDLIHKYPPNGEGRKSLGELMLLVINYKKPTC